MGKIELHCINCSLILFGIQVFCIAGVSPVTVIPHDEFEAASMVQNGILDSVFWNSLRQFYTQPINVPDGGLSQLQKIDGIDCQGLPVEKKDLSQYEPWSSSKISKFYNDYPCLQKFEPVLSFETTPVSGPSFIESGVSCDNRRSASVITQLLFECPTSHLSASGNVHTNDSVMLWHDRLIRWKPYSGLKLQLGNIDVDGKDVLFLGHFYHDNKVQSAKENWLFADDHSFNGLAMESDFCKQFSADLTLHKSPEEEIIAASMGLSGDSFSSAFHFARTALFTSDGIQTANLTWVSVESNIFGYLVTSECGINMNDLHSFPFHMQFVTKSDRGNSEASISFIPRNSMLAHSKTVYEAKQFLVNDGQDSSIEAMTVFDCRTALYGDSLFSTGLNYGIVSSMGNTDCKAGVYLRGSHIIDYVLNYEWHGQIISTHNKHHVYAQARKDFEPGIVSAAVSYNGFVWENGFSQNTVRLPIGLFISPALRFDPFLEISCNSHDEKTIGTGLSQEIRCFKKNVGQWAIQTNWDKKGKNQYLISARTRVWF